MRAVRMRVAALVVRNSTAALDPQRSAVVADGREHGKR